MPSQIAQSLSALSVFGSLFSFCLAIPHLISLWLGTSPSALFPPPLPSCAPASVCIYSRRFIYFSCRGAGLLLVINTQVKWSVTRPGLATRQRCMGVAGTVSTRFPRQQRGCRLRCWTAPCNKKKGRRQGWIKVERKRRVVTHTFSGRKATRVNVACLV